MNDITEVLLFHNVQIASNLLGFVQICLTCIVLFFFPNGFNSSATPVSQMLLMLWDWQRLVTSPNTGCCL